MAGRLEGYVVDLPVDERFVLEPGYVDKYGEKPVPWGFGFLSELIYRRTYARLREDGEGSEQWHQTCARVINGMFTIQKWHCRKLGLRWLPETAQEHAQKAYAGLFNLKWTPPGRGLWMMGTEFVYKKGSAALNNCGFVSTQNIDVDFSHPFVWAFGMSMLGVGVGFDTRGAPKQLRLQEPVPGPTLVVEDSREGWVAVLKHVLDAYSGNGLLFQELDTSQVRPKGSPIKGFGGVASGPQPLRDMVYGGPDKDGNHVPGLLERLDYWQAHRGGVVDSELIVDIMNIAGRCVVSGGIRRSAQIALGHESDEVFSGLKVDAAKQPEIKWWRWASNNTVFCDVGQDYTDLACRTVERGEPGYLWLKNVQDFGRMCEAPNYDDYRAIGTNPCSEQSLEPDELCCLVENAPARCDSLEDFKQTLKYSYMYAKTVTLVPTHDPRTNQVLLRNRRIGCSVTGARQAVERHGYREYFNWLDAAYTHVRDLDKEYSEWLCVPRSIKVTSVKPSGTVSKLIGSTAGVHAAIAKYSIRRVRIADTSDVLQLCRDANIPVEPADVEPNTFIIEYPLAIEDAGKTEGELTIEEQLEFTREHQMWWADNQVSVTIKYRDHEAHKIAGLLSTYDRHLKSVSFLRYFDVQEAAASGTYTQMPVEPITEEEYNRRVAEIDWKFLATLVKIEVAHDREDKFCDGETCVV